MSKNCPVFSVTCTVAKILKSRKTNYLHSKNILNSELISEQYKKEKKKERKKERKKGRKKEKKKRIYYLQ